MEWPQEANHHENTGLNRFDCIGGKPPSLAGSGNAVFRRMMRTRRCIKYWRLAVRLWDLLLICLALRLDRMRRVSTVRCWGRLCLSADRRKALEAVLHPMVQQHRDRFLADHRRAGTAIVVLDVPLLFETGGDSLCDHVIVVYARQETMRARALTRDGMTVKKFDAVVNTQMPVGDKLRRADLALDSDLLPDQTQQCLYDWLTTLGHSCHPSPR